MKRFKNFAIPALIATLIVVNAVVLTKFSDASQKLVEQQSMTIETRNSLQTAHKRVSELSEQKTSIDSSLKKERLKSQKLNKENKRLKASLQAKRKAKAEAAKTATVHTASVQVKTPDVQVTGNKKSWLASSGIPSSEWAYVDYIVHRESGWNPNAVNASSGACGLGQQLPCGKWAGAWNDPVAALKAMDGYAKGRYGSWAAAYSAWQVQHWW